MEKIYVKGLISWIIMVVVAIFGLITIVNNPTIFKEDFTGLVLALFACITIIILPLLIFLCPSLFLDKR